MEHIKSNILNAAIYRLLSVLITNVARHSVCRPFLFLQFPNALADDDRAIFRASCRYEMACFRENPRG